MGKAKLKEIFSREERNRIAMMDAGIPVVSKSRPSIRYALGRKASRAGRAILGASVSAAKKAPSAFKRNAPRIERTLGYLWRAPPGMELKAYKAGKRKR